MWFDHLQRLVAQLEPYELPPDVGRRLDAGGFVLADPFDTILRQLSVAYLHAAWARVDSILKKYSIAAPDLSWGWLHPGEAYTPARSSYTHTRRDQLLQPTDFIGWTSRHLDRFDEQHPEFTAINQELLSGCPALQMGFSWRSLKWSIPPDDAAVGLVLVEYMGIEESTDWAPVWVLRTAHDPAEPWMHIAQALQDNDQHAFAGALSAAEKAYTPAGYRMVRHGYSYHLPAG